MRYETMASAILTANGANELDIISFQKALIQKRCFPKIVGAGSRLITAWAGDKWGHNVAVDVPVGEALGVDYDLLIIPGGSRAMDHLKSTQHTQRIINSFIAAKKPIILMDDATSILEHFGLAFDESHMLLLSLGSENAMANVNSAFQWMETLTSPVDQQAA